MFKKLLPLFVVLALLVAYAGYRAASAQAIGAGNSQNDRSLRNVDPGALSPGFAYWQMQVARMNAVTDHTNLSTGDIAYERSYIDPDDCNIPRVRSPGARAAPVPSC
jgi:hypothetical protein